MNESGALGGWITQLRSRFSPTGWFLLQMAAGALVFTAAAWAFGVVAADVVEGDAITLLDLQIANWFHRNAVPALTRLMLDVSLLHGVVGTAVLTAIVGAWLLWRRERYWLLAFVLAVPGGIVVNSLAKLAFHRMRPTFDDPLVTLTTYSFPSGHTVAATVFYCMLATYLLNHTENRFARIAILVIAPLMVLLVALSRMYLGAHFLSDVLAAAAEGIAWVVLCLMATATLERRRGVQPGVAA